VPDYKVVLVGTDGSETSLRAVDKAAAIAAESNAKLIVASAYLSADSHSGGTDPDQLSGEKYRTEGNAPLYAMLREASTRARAAGAHDVEEKAVEGAPVDALVDLAEEVHADLIVVGDVGLNSVVGRLIGSVPRAVRRRAKTEVLVVETKQ
jgi:nucleotide-binding universal stress UspA family protein